jgi:hypothetical protein
MKKIKKLSTIDAGRRPKAIKAIEYLLEREIEVR